jgi:plastocyanin
MSSRQRLTFAAIAAVIAIVAIIVIAASGGGGSSSDTATGTGAKPARIVVKNGAPVGGITKIKVKKGQTIAFSVQSDTADEVHVHGFNFHKDVTKGGTVSFRFPATITGVFEVELEAAKEQLAQLTIEP